MRREQERTFFFLSWVWTCVFSNFKIQNNFDQLIRLKRDKLTTTGLKREIEDLGRQMKGGIYPAQRMAAPKGYGTGMKPNWHQDQYPLGTPPRGLRAPQVRPPVNQESHSKSYV